MGNYEIVSLQGTGSMGGVFKGWDIALERKVALKVISYDLCSKKEFVDMFFEEARYISQLNHPNISHVYYIGKETVIKILDFGVAQQYKMDTSELVENMAGSPHHICPEAIKGQPVDHRSDIYSLSATFYHALSGAPPFTGYSVVDIFTKHIAVAPVPLKQKYKDIPAFLSNMIDKMLAKSPADRFQSYHEIISALD
ncbi:MAG: serine/threonine-protein kinase [Desulfobacterales bacterium]|jgi:serine/threonine protein kinase|nr:serine/threonine-protein kinase [Desulfobacterales bacterium]